MSVMAMAFEASPNPFFNEGFTRRDLFSAEVIVLLVLLLHLGLVYLTEPVKPAAVDDTEGQVRVVGRVAFLQTPPAVAPSIASAPQAVPPPPKQVQPKPQRPATTEVPKPAVEPPPKPRPVPQQIVQRRPLLALTTARLVPDEMLVPEPPAATVEAAEEAVESQVEPSSPADATDREAEAASAAPPSVMSAGQAISPEAARQAYHARLLSLIDSRKHYPRTARRRKIEGEVAVSLKLTDDGQIVMLECKGEMELLERAACQAVEDARPLPPPPVESTQYDLAFVMEFALR